MKTKAFTAPNGKKFEATFCDNGNVHSVHSIKKDGSKSKPLLHSHYAFEFASTQLWG